MSPQTTGHPPADELTSRLAFARNVVQETNALILGYYRAADLQVERKRDTTPVTEADRRTELLLRERLQQSFPDDAILGEEFPDKAGTTGFRWILDPIDGTKSFIHGVPLFGTLIGVEYHERCVIGVVSFPALNEVVFAAQGQGTWWQIGDREPRRTTASSATRLDEATFCLTNPSRWVTMGRYDALEKLLTSVQLARGWGDCYGHVLVATGRAEVMIDPAMNAWDAAALLPIVEEAGAHFITWEGDATIYGGNGLSVVPGLKDAVLQILQKTVEIDGTQFDTLEGFYDEIGRVLAPGQTWGRNLDALNDLLRGGPSGNGGQIKLVWKNSRLSRERLGYAETIRQLELQMERCHPSNRAAVEYELDIARANRGPTVYDWLLDLMQGTDSSETSAGKPVDLVLA